MTEFTDFQMKIRDFLPEIELRFNEPMSRHTSLRIGGNAEVMAFPKSRGQLSEILKKSEIMDCLPAILGAGTNVLAPDEGVNGLVVCLKDCLSGMNLVDETHISVMAGVTMTRAAVFAAKSGLSGMEFAHGIPGTVGGGIYMNAGAYGGEMSQICESVEVMRRDGEIAYLKNNELHFSYRHSVLQESGAIVISAVLSLNPGLPDEIKSKMRELIQRRTASQPLEYPSAGSAFKRPSVGYAAALIDEAGLKGYRIGEAAISEKHAGFAINLGHATARDMRTLLRNVSDFVQERSGIRLEPEIRIWSRNQSYSR